MRTLFYATQFSGQSTTESEGVVRVAPPAGQTKAGVTHRHLEEDHHHRAPMLRQAVSAQAVYQYTGWYYFVCLWQCLLWFPCQQGMGVVELVKEGLVSQGKTHSELQPESQKIWIELPQTTQPRFLTQHRVGLQQQGRPRAPSRLGRIRSILR